MNLTEQLLTLKNNSANNIPKHKWEIMTQSTQQLIDAHLSEKACKVGDVLPDFKLSDVHGNPITLSELLTKGRLVVSFYRGGWCPYCNLELLALQKHLNVFKKYGVNLVAITPETPDNSLTTSEKNKLDFSVLSDIDNTYAKQLGLVFKLPDNLKQVYHSFGIDVHKHNNNSNYELPMPATYVINQEGVISYAFIPEDYTQRADVSEVLKHIQN